MIRKLSLVIFMIIVFLATGCVKESYDMNKLSKKMHLSPTIAISAVKGDISFSDMVKANDTVVFDQNKFVTIIFKKDSVVDLTLADFSKGILAQQTATIEPDTLDLDIEDILSHITGDFLISNPSIKFNYTNSFTDSVKINLNVTGKRKDKIIDLNLAPFKLTMPDTPVQQEISDSYTIDKNNSSLPDLISLPPEKIYFSGNAVLTPSAKNNQLGNSVLGSNRLIGSLEVEVPMEFRLNNLQFTDTVDNFIEDKGSSNDNQIKPEDFNFIRVKISAKNGFPLGVSLNMSLYDSLTHTIKSSVDAVDILKPAPVDSNGKVTGVTETSTIIEFTREFFSFVNKADKIIFRFTLVTTGNGLQDVKIYSDYRINFNAALVVKPDINLK
jgi:hypothetical protein